MRVVTAGTGSFPSPCGKALVGFDGFVDEVIHMVDKRISPTEYTRIETIGDYAERIRKYAGLSGNLEMVPVCRKLGGNGAIFAHALQKLSVPLCYVGSVGLSEIHPVFREMAACATMIGIAEPAETSALEFQDGKLICSKLKSLNELNWAQLCAALPPQRFARLVDESALLSFNNWSMIVHMNELWEGILDEVLPQTTADLSQKTLFIDLADPEKRNPEELLKALALLRRFAEHKLSLILGLNLKEAWEVLALYGFTAGTLKAWSLEKLTRTVSEKTGLPSVTIHPVDTAAFVCGDAYCEADGPVCKHPVLTTGAGDNYNAGFVFAVMKGLPMEDCLALGIAASGFYVRKGRSATGAELAAYMKSRAKGNG